MGEAARAEERLEADERLQAAVAAARAEERQEADQRLQEDVAAARDNAVEALEKTIKDRLPSLLMTRRVMQQRLEEAIAADKKGAEEKSSKSESVEAGVQVTETEAFELIKKD